MTALTIDAISKRYVRSHLWKRTISQVLSGLSLEVQEGEIFGLLGLNGVGKTTTIKILLGLLFPDKGSAHIFGCPAGTPEAKKKIGYLPETPYFVGYLTAEEMLRYFAALSGIPRRDQRARINEVFSAVGLESAMKKPVGEYSKGMLQRLGIAQAVIASPALLILDEPWGGLDPLGIKQIRETILALKKQGHTIFLTSHLLSEISKVCDRIGIISGGAIRTIVQKESESALESIFVKATGLEHL